MTSQMLKKLQEVSAHDQRRTTQDFYQTFDLDRYYSPSMIHMIISGKRNAQLQFKEFLARCLNIYDQNTDDYSDVNGTMLAELQYQWERKTGARITYETLARFAAPNSRNIKSAFERHTETTNAIFDVLFYGFMDLERNENSYTNTVTSYLELKRRLMRAEIGDGVHTRTLEEVAEEAKLDAKDLADLPDVCKDSKKFLQVYQGLVRIQKPYVVEK